jgi:hypothetical protein
MQGKELPSAAMKAETGARVGCGPTGAATFFFFVLKAGTDRADAFA